MTEKIDNPLSDDLKTDAVREAVGKLQVIRQQILDLEFQLLAADCQNEDLDLYQK